jgi:hypothetical protein
MMAILGVVAVITLGSALLFQSRNLRTVYQLDPTANGKNS